MTRSVNSILAHPALAGRTLLIRRDGTWAAHEIQPQGCLGEPRTLDSDPAVLGWRSGRAA